MRDTPIMSDDEDEPITWTVPKRFIDPNDEDPEEEEEWNEDHIKLLYMISLYAKCAQSPTDKEGWIRMIPMYALMYELKRHSYHCNL